MIFVLENDLKLALIVITLRFCLRLSWKVLQKGRELGLQTKIFPFIKEFKEDGQEYYFANFRFS
jgi:hypothetical protein